MNALNPSFRIGAQMAEILKLHKGLTSKEAKAESIRLAIPGSYPASGENSE
ncbi:MAG: hypothetical protein M0T74_09555 [Desulfitobacterium hafniense]|nr:hypothetical protein [Desulfitobacterium hafniense]